MRFEPINPNPSWPAQHTIYIAKTGGGKSQMLLQNPDVPKKPVPGERVIMWDQAGDHPGLHYRKWSNFLRALATGIERGQGFRIAYAGPRTIEIYEKWCEVVWSMLDGRFRTWVIVEEMSKVSPSSAKASPNAAVLLNEGRKYGMVFHGTSQRPAEVAKTYYDAADVRYVGRQKGRKLQERMADEIGLEVKQIAALQPLQFYRDDDGDEPRLIKLEYKKPRGVVWKD